MFMTFSQISCFSYQGHDLGQNIDSGVHVTQTWPEIDILIVSYREDIKDDCILKCNQLTFSAVTISIQGSVFG